MCLHMCFLFVSSFFVVKSCFSFFRIEVLFRRFLFHFVVIGLLHFCCLLCLLATILSSKNFHHGTLKLFNSKPCKCSTWQPNQFLRLMNEIVKHARIHMMSSQNVMRYFGWSFFYFVWDQKLWWTQLAFLRNLMSNVMNFMYTSVCVCFFFSYETWKKYACRLFAFSGTYLLQAI